MHGHFTWMIEESLAHEKEFFFALFACILVSNSEWRLLWSRCRPWPLTQMRWTHCRWMRQALTLCTIVFSAWKPFEHVQNWKTHCIGWVPVQDVIPPGGLANEITSPATEKKTVKSTFQDFLWCFSQEHQCVYGSASQQVSRFLALYRHLRHTPTLHCTALFF